MTRRIRGSLTLLASTPARWLAGKAAALAGRTKGPRQTGQADRAGPRRARRPALLGLGLLLAGWLALGSIPVSDALWSDLLEINGTVATGSWGGTITIKKDVYNSSTEPADFTFTHNIPAPCTIGPLDDDSGSATPDSSTCAQVPAGSYTVTEVDPSPAFTLMNLACVSTGDPADTTTWDVSTRTATIDLDTNETVVCTYTNVRSGTIRITKDAEDFNGVHHVSAQDFVFTTTGTGLTNFTLDDDSDPTLSNTRLFSGLTPGGTRTIKETTMTTWTLENIVCTGGASVTYTGASGGTGSFEFGDDTVSIVLGTNENVVCTFYNIQVPPECAGLFNNPNPDRVYITDADPYPFIALNQDQILVGREADDFIVSGNAKDCILGNGGNDIIKGQNGSDVLLGGAGDDLILGQEGQDYINGGPGTDVCDLGAGGGETKINCELEPADLDITMTDDTPAGEDLSATGGFSSKIQYTLKNDGGPGPVTLSWGGAIGGTATRTGVTATVSGGGGLSCSTTLTSWTCSGTLNSGASNVVVITVTGTTGGTVTYTPDAPACSGGLTCLDGLFSSANTDSPAGFPAQASDLTPAADTDTIAGPPALAPQSAPSSAPPPAPSPTSTAQSATPTNTAQPATSTSTASPPSPTVTSTPRPTSTPSPTATTGAAPAPPPATTGGSR